MKVSISQWCVISRPSLLFGAVNIFQPSTLNEDSCRKSGVVGISSVNTKMFSVIFKIIEKNKKL